MKLEQIIKKILRQELNIPPHIRRRYTCMDEYVTKLENGQETLPVRIRQLDWNYYKIIITTYIRLNCGDGDGYYDPTIHSKIMDIFGDRLYKWYKDNIDI